MAYQMKGDVPAAKQTLQSFLLPYPSELMMAYPVSLLVNNPRHDDPRCVEPLT